MSDFQVTLRVSSSRLGTVLEALKGAAELLSVLPCEAPSVAKPTRALAYVNGKRNKGISGPELVLKSLREREPRTREEFAAIFTLHGFAETSFSPSLTGLKEKGLVALVAPGKYGLTQKGKEEFPPCE